MGSSAWKYDGDSGQVFREVTCKGTSLRHELSRRVTVALEIDTDIRRPLHGCRTLKHLALDKCVKSWEYLTIEVLRDIPESIAEQICDRMGAR